MTRLSVLAALAASPAAAHGLPAAHAHPHGAEAIVLGISLVAACLVFWKLGR